MASDYGIGQHSSWHTSLPSELLLKLELTSVFFPFWDLHICSLLCMEQSAPDSFHGNLFLLFFLMFYLNFWETECKQRRGRERGRHRTQSKLQAWSCQHRAQCGAWNHQREIMTWTKVRRLTSWATQAPPWKIYFYPRGFSMHSFFRWAFPGPSIYRRLVSPIILAHKSVLASFIVFTPTCNYTLMCIHLCLICLSSTKL